MPSSECTPQESTVRVYIRQNTDGMLKLTWEIELESFWLCENWMKTPAASRYLLFSGESLRDSSGSGSAVSSGTHTGYLFPLCLPWTLLSTFHLVPSWLQNDLQLLKNIPSEKEGMDISEFPFHKEKIIHWNCPENYPLQLSLAENGSLDQPSWQDRLWRQASSRGDRIAVIGSDC